MTVSLGFKSRNQDPGDHTKRCYSTCLISFSKHMEVIIGWLEEGTRRPEAVLENKSRWNVCHLESCAVPRVETRFRCWAACSAATCTAGSSCSPEANSLYCPGSMECCKVLVSWSAPLLDLSKLHELPHTSSTAAFILFIYVCITIRLLYQKILKTVLQLFPVCFPLLVNVSGINSSILALFKSTKFLSYDLVLSWCPECPVWMRAPLQLAPCKHNTEPSLKKLGSASLGACQAESLGNVSEGGTLQVGLLQGK